ncbi:MAG: SRPBCC domain-containing protein [Burkholderiales bacterium]|nr:SRPBCC domain-containing protein [Burkholderiales bacterium]
MSTFHTQRELPFAPAAVFAAIQDPTRLAKWWGPNGFTNVFDTFEFKPGGQWVFSMIGPDGKTYPNESVFQAIDPGRQVVIQHLVQPHFVLTISLHSSPTGTLVDWEQVFADAAVANAVRHIVEPANEQNLDRLTAALQSSRADQSFPV